eukprot:518970_1
MSLYYDKSVLNTLANITIPIKIPDIICQYIAEYCWQGIHFQHNEGVWFLELDSTSTQKFEHYYEQIIDIFNNTNGFVMKFQLKLSTKPNEYRGEDMWFSMLRAFMKSNPSKPVDWDADDLDNTQLIVMGRHNSEFRLMIGLWLGCWEIKQISDTIHHVHVEIHCRYDKSKRGHRVKIKCSDSVIFKPLLNVHAVNRNHIVKIKRDVVRHLNSHSCLMTIAGRANNDNYERKTVIYDLIMAAYPN